MNSGSLKADGGCGVRWGSKGSASLTCRAWLARAAGADLAVGNESEGAVEGGIIAVILMGADAFGEAPEQSGEAAVGQVAGVLMPTVAGTGFFRQSSQANATE